MVILTSPEDLLAIYSKGWWTQTCYNENAYHFPKELTFRKYKYALNANSQGLLLEAIHEY